MNLCKMKADDLQQTIQFPAEGKLPWFVAHTKPRCEKKLFEHCRREGISVTLPLYQSARKYRGKVVVFEKPLFPGYVFLRLEPLRKAAVEQNDHVANLLDVHDQETLERQLQEILCAIEAGLNVRLAPTIGEGMRVRIKNGPLRGVEGWVERRHGMGTVLLRLDFINQAAAVQLDAESVELV